MIYILTISHKCTTWHFSNNHFNIIHFDTPIGIKSRMNRAAFCVGGGGGQGAGFHVISNQLAQANTPFCEMPGSRGRNSLSTLPMHMNLNPELFLPTCHRDSCAPVNTQLPTQTCSGSQVCQQFLFSLSVTCSQGRSENTK